MIAKVTLHDKNGEAASYETDDYEMATTVISDKMIGIARTILSGGAGEGLSIPLNEVKRVTIDFL